MAMTRLLSVNATIITMDIRLFGTEYARDPDDLYQSALSNQVGQWSSTSSDKLCNYLKGRSDEISRSAKAN